MDYKKLLEEKLREAACFGDVETLKELISNGVNVNSKNNVNGWTALHWAACRGNIEIVSILLSNGAEKNCVTHKGELPSDLSNSEKIKVLLGGELSRKQQQELPIIPNYLKNPPLFCEYIKTSETKCITKETFDSDEVLVLKLRVAESLESDFIEIELPKSELSFEKLQEVCCKELDVTPDAIIKIRKLPNTIVRNNKDVLRLKDFQELESDTLSSLCIRQLHNLCRAFRKKELNKAM